MTPAVFTVQPSTTRSDGAPIRPAANRGVLMTIGHYHGYPCLPFKPGTAVAEGETAWRTFTRSADDVALILAAQAARAAWSDDPMTHDLTYLEHGSAPEVA